jgi:chromosome segregation ATPase
VLSFAVCLLLSCLSSLVLSAALLMNNAPSQHTFTPVTFTELEQEHEERRAGDVAALQATNANLARELQQAQEAAKRIPMLEAELSELTAVHRATSDEKEELQHRLDSILSSLTDCTKEKQQLRDAIAALQAALDAELASNRRKSVEKEATQIDNTAELEAARGELKGMKRQLEAAASDRY